MAKKILEFDIEDHLDFEVIGIVCAYKDYRLCFEINQALNVEFKKTDDLELRLERKHSTGWFSLYQYISADEEEFYLIANKGNHTWFVPEQKHIDFFLVIRNRSPFTDTEAICRKLRDITLINSVIPMEVASLKSADNFLYIEPDYSIL
jgi:hypothetical protein